MLKLSGKLLNIVESSKTDRETGEVSKVFTAEVLHTVRGKSVIDTVKIDQEVFPAWEKLIGKDVDFEVRTYAIQTREGGILSGLTLADKKALPVVGQTLAAAFSPGLTVEEKKAISSPLAKAA